MAADATGAETNIDLNVDVVRGPQNVGNIHRDSAESRPVTSPRAIREHSEVIEGRFEVVEEHSATIIDLRTAEPIVEIDRIRPTGLAAATTLQLGIKRTVDIVVAATALLFLAPLVLAAAMAVKVTSRGPVFFKQPRVGETVSCSIS